MRTGRADVKTEREKGKQQMVGDGMSEDMYVFRKNTHCQVCLW